LITRGVAALILLLLCAADVKACSIPVFRFALERWAADLYEVDVYFRGELTADERRQLSTIEDLAAINGGSINLEVVRCDVDGKLADDLERVWNDLGDVPLPHVVLRAPGGRRGSPQVWSGPLTEFSPALVDSPARQELVRRLLRGDSIVWLVLPGTDVEAAKVVTQRLEAALAALSEEITIPRGVGLPGSELASGIPFHVKFSVLTAPRETEAAFRAQLAAQLRYEEEPRDGDPWASGETLVAPVFGRGRALQSLPAAEVDDDAIAEVCRFLCGACSCQVKELNPGFDLLLAVNWDERLFAPGEPIATEPPPADASETAPQLVAIAPGRAPSSEVHAPDVASAPPTVEDLTSAKGRPTKPNPGRQPGGTLLILIPVALLGFAGLCYGIRWER
jgi:hypothetical protein